MEASLEDLQERILTDINNKKWNQVDELWAEVIEFAPLPLEFHQPIIDKLLRKQQPQHFTDLYTLYVDDLLEKEEGEAAQEVVEYILAKSDDEEFVRPRLLKIVDMLHKSVLGDLYDSFMQRSGLDEEATKLKKSYQSFKDLMGATKGEVFKHAKWGVGVVRELDINAGSVIIDFPMKPNQKMTLEGVRNYLQPIPQDHLLARIAKHGEELKDDAKNDPVSILKLSLNSYGGRVKVSDMKKVLTTRFLSDNEYKSFWNNARKAIKIDPWIEQVGSGVHSQLVLRETPRSFFDEIIQKLATASNAIERREVLRDVRRHGTDAEMTQDDREALYHLYVKPVTDGAIKEEAELFHHGILFLEYNDLFENKENPVDVEALLTEEKAIDLIGGLTLPDSRRLALEKTMHKLPEAWPHIFAEVTITLDPRTVSWMEKEMSNIGAENERQAALESIFAKPDHNPDLFVWAAKNVLNGTFKQIGESLPPMMICEELLSLLSELEESFEASDPKVAAAAKAAAVKVRTVFSEGNSKLFKAAVKTSNIEEARKILQMVRLHNAISHQMKRTLEDILVDAHIELRKTSRLEEEEEKLKPSHHYTTRDSLDSKRQELSHLLSIEIPGMAPVIEAARELGDLKENAEYHAAKDRQKLLMQQAAELEDLIARARVVEEREVTPETSRFGTQVKLRKVETGEESAYTLMGMWEADLRQNIISYLTPFGSQLLDRKVGEVFAVNSQDGTQTDYEVLDISKAPQLSSVGDSS